jgi:hypothetical protein
MPIVDMPRNKFECWANRLHYQDYHRQFVSELALSCSQLALSALKEIEATPSLISLDGYRDLRPLNQALIAIAEPAMNQGLIVVELCGEILSATEALIRTGIKIQKLYVCKIDPEARAFAAARLQVLSKMFPELLPSEAFASCFSFLPQDIALIKQEHVQKLGPVDLIICGFSCQGFSRATRRAQGLRDPCSSVFLDMVNLIHEITYTHGDCGWLIESVDATDHKNVLVRDEYNQVVKGILGPGYAFDAVAVGSYEHRFRRFWTNLISTTLLHSMVEKQVCFSFSRSICAGHPRIRKGGSTSLTRPCTRSPLRQHCGRTVESFFNIRDTKAFRCLSFTGLVTRILSIAEAGGAILA